MDTLTALLASRAKAGIFRLLFGPGAGELHGREIARRAGLNEATVRQELKRLMSIHLVQSRKDGNRTLYRADADHPLYPEIRGIVRKTSGLGDLLRTALRRAPIRLAFVFGSLAEGTERPGSDLDLMVVGDLSLRELSRLLAPLSGRLGREINPHVLDVREWARRRRQGDPFLKNVLHGRKLFVIGDEHELEAVG